jgi:hypothetical protein
MMAVANSCAASRKRRRRSCSPGGAPRVQDGSRRCAAAAFRRHRRTAFRHAIASAALPALALTVAPRYNWCIISEGAQDENGPARRTLERRRPSRHAEPRQANQFEHDIHDADTAKYCQYCVRSCLCPLGGRRAAFPVASWHTMDTTSRGCARTGRQRRTNSRISSVSSWDVMQMAGPVRAISQRR